MYYLIYADGEGESVLFQGTRPDLETIARKLRGKNPDARVVVVRRAPLGPPAPPPEPPRGLRVLLVGGDPDTAGLAAALGGDGHEVDTAADGPAGLRAA